MAKSQGAVGIGPVTKASKLQKAIDRGVEATRRSKVVVVDAALPGCDAEG